MRQSSLSLQHINAYLCLCNGCHLVPLDSTHHVICEVTCVVDVRCHVVPKVSIDHVISKVTRLESNVHLTNNQVYCIMYVIIKIMANSLYLKQYKNRSMSCDCILHMLRDLFSIFQYKFKGNVSKTVEKYRINCC